MERSDSKIRKAHCTQEYMIWVFNDFVNMRAMKHTCLSLVFSHSVFLSHLFDPLMFSPLYKYMSLVSGWWILSIACLKAKGSQLSSCSSMPRWELKYLKEGLSMHYLTSQFVSCLQSTHLCVSSLFCSLSGPCTCQCSLCCLFTT